MLLLFCATAVNGHAAIVDQQRLLGAHEDPANWLTYGRTFSEQRFVPLADINSDNVAGLGLAWYADIPSTDGLTATPLVIDGRIFLSAPFANVYAFDAATGKLIWRFDPRVDPSASMMSSWGSRVNRGVAAWQDKIFVGTGDCRLIAIHAADGTRVWEQRTCDSSIGQAINGAPRAANGKVFIGNTGADVAARGYVSAHDTETGEQIWRFYTVPGDPAKGFENPAMEMAAKTWTGDAWWQAGGGAAWDSLVYDPGFNQLLIGTDSAVPWDHGRRSPQGGDNLFTNAIVAVDADTGEYRWHYQTVPADSWDFNATMHIMLADLELDGREYKVLMQAPKNGFFYVIERHHGKLLSANNFTTVTWAERIDIKTGRPVEIASARYEHVATRRATVKPGMLGGHSWQPMSYHPGTGLVYIPALDVPTTWEISHDAAIGGVEFEMLAIDANDREGLQSTGFLVAWDPRTQSARWRFEHALPINGGVLATAGNLVFQGTGAGEFHAHAADTGALLWSRETGSRIQAPPISYSAGGEQYVLLPIGAGGTGALFASAYLGRAATGPSRLLAYKIDGKQTLPPVAETRGSIPAPPDQKAPPKSIERGRKLYTAAGCQACHGINVVAAVHSSFPDLRYLGGKSHAEWQAVVLGGSRRDKGMIPYNDVLSVQDSEAIRLFVIARQREDYQAQQATP